MNQEVVIQTLDKLYDHSLKGIPKLSKPAEELANDYLQKNGGDVKAAAKSLINYQIAKCTTTGFVTGLGGLITLPVAIPLDIIGTGYVQLQMIAALAHMGGYEVKSDQTRTLVYICYAGISLGKFLKNAGVQAGTKLSMALIKKIPGKVFIGLNKKIGFRLITKGGSKGVINLGKAVPLVGAIISGVFDMAETKVIANRAYKIFIEGKTDLEERNDDNGVVKESLETGE